MKHKKLFRSVTALLAALVLMGGFSVTAFAGGGDVSDEPPTPVTETEPEETTGGYEPQPLTPEGNMSLVDDITGEASGDKQFITVVTKNGNYFYIIIDRAEDGENTVHFLNQVDEADLTALMEDGQTEAPVCSCTEKMRCRKRQHRLSRLQRQHERVRGQGSRAGAGRNRAAAGRRKRRRHGYSACRAACCRSGRRRVLLL